MDNPLTRKVGPLPVWAWTAGLVGAWWAYYLFFGGRDTGGSDVPTESTDLPVGDIAGTVNQDGSSNGLVTSPALSDRGSVTPQTPEAWASIVSDWLIGNGKPVTAVQSAFAKLIRVINGDLPANSFTPQEIAVLNEGIQHFGSPPTGPVEYSQTPASSVPTAPSTPAKKWVATGRFGTSKGHPVSFDYLIGTGYLKRVGGKLVTTAKLGGRGGHPVSYDYLAGIGLIKAA